MPKKLVLNFITSGNNTFTLTIDEINSNIEESYIVNLIKTSIANDIIKKGYFKPNGESLVKLNNFKITDKNTVKIKY